MGEAELISSSVEETEAVAARIARALQPGDVVLVCGEVGTGKTSFVRGACRALGVTGNIASPSFTIGRTYAGSLPISHLDLFRLESLDGEDPALLADYLRPDSVAFVEWPRAALAELEPERLAATVSLIHLGEDRRGVQVRAREDVMERLGA